MDAGERYKWGCNGWKTVLNKISGLFQIVCLAFVVLATIQYEAQDRLAQPEPGAENNKGEIMLRKLLGYTYKCFIASLYWALYIKVPRKVEILNGMVGKYRQFHAHGGVHSKSKVRSRLQRLTVLI